LTFKGISLKMWTGDDMKENKEKTVRLVISQELYEAVKKQAIEQFRTVPKEIVQILRTYFCVR